MHQINPNSSSSQGSRSSPSRSPCHSRSSQVERPRLATDSRNSYSQGCCRFFQNRASDVMGLQVRHESHGATQPLSLSIWDLTPSPGIASPRVCLRGAVSFTTDLGTLSGSSDDPNPAARLFTATSALARLPPADVELWTYGSVAPGVGPNSSSTSTVCCTPLKLIQPASSLRTSVKRLSPSVWASLP